MEDSPLDKAEWIKVFAAFFGKQYQQKGDSLFVSVESSYKKKKMEAALYSYIPKVTIGFPWKGTWYVSGAESFQAQMIADAGGHYIWNTKDYLQTASVPLTFETAFQKGIDADIWINPGSMKSKKEITDEFEELAEFKSYKNYQIYSNYKASNLKGANDYWERAVVRPDLILEDLVKIFHPSEAKKELNYYLQLPEE